MQNYLDLLKDILYNGIEKDSRAGKVKSVFGKQLEWDLSEGFPILTTRKIPLRIAFEETWMFLRGDTDTKILEDKNIFIWQGNTTREFLDNRGLKDLPEGSLGKGYSHQWRNFNGELGGNDGVDQVVELLNGLKDDPNSRRHIVIGWNPSQLDEMALPPCHLYNQYAINDGKLDSSFVMRSNDFYHGCGFNIMGYALLNYAFAKYLGLKPGKLVYFGNDVHLYDTQYEVAKMQLERVPRKLPTLSILKDLDTIEDVLSMEFADLELNDYDPHPPLPKVNMAV